MQRKENGLIEDIAYRVHMLRGIHSHHTCVVTDEDRKTALEFVEMVRNVGGRPARR